MIEHYKLVDKFTLNLDETSMGGNDGELKILGDRNKRKQEKNTSDNRESITAVRLGSAGNVDGPRYYLAKGKEIDAPTFKNFDKNYPAPKGSRVIMTPNAYMKKRKTFLRRRVEGRPF